MPGMISAQEEEYLKKFTSEHYTHQGAIVDLGCWLGSSTVALADGLGNNPDPKAHATRIHAYDIFIWEDWMNTLTCVVGTPLEGRYKHGDSFLEECIDQTRLWQENIKFYPGDLAKIGWHGEPIEFLFVDAMKSWTLANRIIHDFYSALIPGHSIVVQQDFSSFYVYWLHLSVYRFRDYFEPIYDIPYSSSLVFKYIKAIPDELLRATYSLSDFSDEEIRAAFDYAGSLVSPEKRPQLAVAKARLYMDRGDRDQVEVMLAELSQRLYELPYTIMVSEQAKFQAQMVSEQAKFQAQMVSEQAKFQAQMAQWQEESCKQLQSVSAPEPLLLQPSQDDALLERLCKCEYELEQSKYLIAAMEDTKFWKLRRAWVEFKKTLGIEKRQVP